MKKYMNVEQPYLWHQNGIPRTGEFLNGKYKYSFHGVGCEFHMKDKVIDYDYGDQGRIDGFDLWRLSGYGEKNTTFKDYIESGKIKTDFDKAIEAGDIKKLFSDKNDDLYYKVGEQIQFAIGCLDTFEFIDLHEWPIIEHIGHLLHRGQNLDELDFCTSPAVIIDKAFIVKSINEQDADYEEPKPPYADFLEDEYPEEEYHEEEYQECYVEELIPFVREFVSDPQKNQFFIICDSNDLPWEIGQPRWYKWKEHIAYFDYESRSLPRNLIDDYKLFSWDQVLELNREKDEWILHEQCKDELLELKEKYLDLLNKK